MSCLSAKRLPPRVEMCREQGIVRKVYSSRVVDEYQKACSLYELSKAEHYVFAQPQRILLSESIIEYALVSPCTSLYELIKDLAIGHADIEHVTAVMQLCGRALAAVHRELALDSPGRWSPPRSFATSLARYGCSPTGTDISDNLFAFGHGDFGFSNILVQVGPTGSPCIHVIDSSPNDYSCRFVASFEPVYVDAGLFVAGLTGRIPLRFQARLRRWEEELVRAFIDPYEADMRVRLDRGVLAAYACASVRSYRRGQRYGPSSWARRAALHGLEWRMARRLTHE